MKPNERPKAAAAEGATAEEMRGTVLPFTPRRRPAYADSAAEAMLRFWPWPGAWPQGSRRMATGILAASDTASDPANRRR